MFLWFSLRNLIKIHKPLCQQHYLNNICRLNVRFRATRAVVKENFVDDVNSTNKRKLEDCDRKTSDVLKPIEQLFISRCILFLF